MRAGDQVLLDGERAEAVPALEHLDQAGGAPGRRGLRRATSLAVEDGSARR